GRGHGKWTERRRILDVEQVTDIGRVARGRGFIGRMGGSLLSGWLVSSRRKVVFTLVVAAFGSLLGSGGATSGIGMCGRFIRYYTWAKIHRLYRLTTPDSNFEPRYSVCPKKDIDTVV